jgi:hypothetical protein
MAVNNGTSTGRFTAGNPGRPKGARNKLARPAITQLAEAGPQLIAKAISQALSGDAMLLRCFLDRIDPAPRGRFIRFPVPLPTSADLAFEVILTATGNGLLTTAEARDISELLQARQGATEISDLQMRMAAMEERLYAATPREP